MLYYVLHILLYFYDSYIEYIILGMIEDFRCLNL